MNIQGYKYDRSRSIQPFIRGPREEVEKKHLNLLKFKRRKTFKSRQNTLFKMRGLVGGVWRVVTLVVVSTTKEVPHNLLGTTVRSTILHLGP